MRNLTVVVAWHGGSPKVSTSCFNPRGRTLSLENPHKQTLTGSSFSFPMPILSKDNVKMMSAELLLSTRTLWIVLLATTAFITSGSSWGCWKPSMSESEKVMVVCSQGSLDTACASNVSPDLMLCRWAFLAEMDSPPPANALEITWLPKAAGAELGLADEVVVAGLVLALLRPHNGKDVRVESGI